MKLFTVALVLCLSQVISSERIVNCYWGTWANYRLGNGKFDTTNIDTNLCTHLSYAFFSINDDGSIKSTDEWLDLDSGLGFISKAVALKNKNKNLKLIATVGGWNDGSAKYSAMAANANKRKQFITTAVNFIRQHGFDGLDLDWEYPAQRDGSPADRANFVTLLKEIKQAFTPYGLGLSVAVGAGESIAKVSYDIPNIAQNVDFINVMTYDFHSAADGVLGFNAPIGEVESAINYWLAQGAPANKLVLGIGSYGHTFQLSNPSQNKPGAPSSGDGAKGDITATPGMLGYNEICLNKWQQVFDSTAACPYAFSGNQWVGFDNVLSVQYKMDLLLKKNLGGAMMWSIETDDFRGLCGESWPLLKAINKKLR